MKKEAHWLNTMTIVGTMVALTDLNIHWYHHRDNTAPELKYTVVILSVLLFVFIVYLSLKKKKSSKK